MAFKVFGVQFGKDKQLDTDKKPIETIVPRDDQGALVIEKGFGGQSAEFFIYGQSSEINFRSQKDRIELYRKMCENPYVDTCVDDIVNEAITFDTQNDIVSLRLDRTTFSDSVKKAILDEFSEVLRLMDFDFSASDIFRQWFVDGQTYVHVIVDGENTQDGIRELRFVDPRAIQKVVEITTDQKTGVETDRREFYLYMPLMALDKKNLVNANSSIRNTNEFKAVKLTPDSVVYNWSGRTNNDGFVISNMDRAIKAWNQINSLEDAFLVYHLSRAPSKRAFYIDTGDLPKKEAEKYMTTIIEKYKNKAIYDVHTGKIDNAAQIQSMFHDFWLPRQNGKNTTEIGNIDGTTGQFAGPEELEYWLKKLWRAFKIPITRLNSESVTAFGRGSEITRDELKFQKYIDKLRNRFSGLFSDLLKRQLLLKNIITIDDWEENHYNIRFLFSADSMFFEMKSSEVLNMRLQTLSAIRPWVGKFFTRDYVMKEVLMMSEEEIVENDKKMEEERVSGVYDEPGMDEEGNTIQPSELKKGEAGTMSISAPGNSVDPNKGSAYSSPKSKNNPQASEFSRRDTVSDGGDISHQGKD